MKVKMLQLDTDLSSGRHYSSEKVQEAIDKLKEANPEYMLGIVKKAAISPTIDESVGVLQDLKIEEGFLTGEVAAIEERMNEFDGKSIMVRPIGFGEWDDDGTLKEYMIVGGLIISEDQETEKQEEVKEE